MIFYGKHTKEQTPATPTNVEKGRLTATFGLVRAALLYDPAY